VVRLLGLIGVYLAALVAGILMFNANAENNWVVVGIWSAASVVLGWSLARWSAAFLPFVAIPIAVPFGYADD
jgi:hypothetical protein